MRTRSHGVDAARQAPPPVRWIDVRNICNGAASLWHARMGTRSSEEYLPWMTRIADLVELVNRGVLKVGGLSVTCKLVVEPFDDQGSSSGRNGSLGVLNAHVIPSSVVQAWPRSPKPAEATGGNEGRRHVTRILTFKLL